VLTDSVAAISVGIIDGTPMLDLPYEEDVRAETDMNVVVTGSGDFVEVQGTAEGVPFKRAELDALLDLALGGTSELAEIQRETLGNTKCANRSWSSLRATRASCASCANGCAGRCRAWMSTPRSLMRPAQGPAIRLKTRSPSKVMH